jgi:hypothetical protein
VQAEIIAENHHEGSHADKIKLQPERSSSGFHLSSLFFSLKNQSKLEGQQASTIGGRVFSFLFVLESLYNIA